MNALMFFSRISKGEGPQFYGLKEGILNPYGLKEGIFNLLGHSLKGNMAQENSVSSIH